MTKDYLIEQVNQRFSFSQIAKNSNCSIGNVRYWLKKYNLKTDSKLLHSCECGENNPINFYQKSKQTCKICHNKKRGQVMRDVKTLALEYKGNKCSRCGYNKCVAALEFHHIDPTQKDPKFRQMRNGTFENLKPELDKCILVCANCHREIDTQERTLSR